MGQDCTKTLRENKGASLIELLDDFTVIDVETTGLDPKYDSIIELAAIKYRNGLPVEEFCTLVNPCQIIDDFITELTGITNEMLSQAPEISEVLTSYLNFIDSDIVVGHNVNFDINFIYDQAAILGLPSFGNDYVDTMRLSRRLFKEERHHRLCDLVERFSIDSVAAHRALADCATTVKCYEYMKDYINKNGLDLAEIIKKKSTSVKAADLSASTDDFDEGHPLYKQTCVFTGKMEKMTRKEAMQAVLDIGGFCGDRITKETNYLVIGNFDYCSTIKDGKSNKQKKAEQYKLEGINIESVSENTFYELLNMH